MLGAFLQSSLVVGESASATPLTKITAKAIEANSRTILLIPIHPSLLGRRKKGVKPPPRNVTESNVACMGQGRICQVAISGDELPRIPLLGSRVHKMVALRCLFVGDRAGGRAVDVLLPLWWGRGANGRS